MNIVDSDGQVCPGCFDEPVNFNYRDYRYRDFFGREKRGWAKRRRFHAFHYLGLVSESWTFGLALIDLGYAKTMFSFLRHREEGQLFFRDWKGPGFSRRLEIPRQPDAHTIRFRGKKGDSITLEKSLEELRIDCRLGPLDLQAEVPYRRETHQPLRVLSPSSPSCWTFTEKAAPLFPRALSLRLNGKELPLSPRTSPFVYDWSAGYMRRETNWYWASLGGRLEDGRGFGANLAALVNESFYNENAFWVVSAPHQKTRRRLSPVIFAMDQDDLYRPWHLYTEDRTLDLTFTPEGETGQRVNAGPLKTRFRQLFGTFSGTARTAEGESLAVKEIPGFCEYHRALW